jgi:hypothetical protein
MRHAFEQDQPPANVKGTTGGRPTKRGVHNHMHALCIAERAAWHSASTSVVIEYPSQPHTGLAELNQHLQQRQGVDGPDAKAQACIWVWRLVHMLSCDQPPNSALCPSRNPRNETCTTRPRKQKPKHPNGSI